MKKKRYLYLFITLVLIALIGILACSLLATKKDHIQFSHKTHAEEGIDCTDCHSDVDVSDNAKTSHIPDKLNCRECHEENMDACTKCHTDSKSAKKFKRVENHLIFSHKTHTERTSGKCRICHEDAVNSTTICERKLPQMAPCLGCHEHKVDFNNGNCRKCHTELKEYPLKPMADYSHDGNFITEHKILAKGKENVCAQCHDYSFCSDCHAKTTQISPAIKYPEKPDRLLIHRADYVSRHAIEARADPGTCSKCHGSSFCMDCHTREGVSKASKNPDSPHSYNYTANHGRDARKKITQCMACHDKGEKSNCVQCHKTGGINPHPSSWTWRNKDKDKKNNKMCKICHIY